jgi:hypothetical protein
MNEQHDLREACRRFVAAAFDVLARRYVIPTPIFHPYVAVGRDYYGDDIRGLAEYGTLESLLNEAYPDRFADPRGRRNAEFASSYMFSFLEACIARCGRNQRFDPGEHGVDESVDELLQVLDGKTYTVVCCRYVSHLTTSGNEVQLGDITVVPEPDGFGGFVGRIQQEIRGAARAWNRDYPRPYDPPHALLIARETAADPDPYEVDRRLSVQLDRFLLLARLLTAGSVQSAYEVSGMTTLVSRMNPVMRDLGRGWFDTLVRRTVRLT